VYELGDIFLGMTVPIDQLAIALCLLDRVQVLTLDVLDQRNLGRSRIVDLANDRGNGVKPGALRSSPPALAGDDLKAVTMRTKQDRLQDAPFRNRVGEFVDRLFPELHTRLLRIGANATDLDLTDAARTHRSLFAGCGSRRSLLPKKRLKTSS
jgi:hypothetical protein